MKDALKAWADIPINDYGTPHINMPEDYTPAEQKEFCDFVRQDRFVSREEQIAKHKEIMTARERQFTHCSACGGEKDGEGWCANYCMDSGG